MGGGCFKQWIYNTVGWGCFKQLIIFLLSGYSTFFTYHHHMALNMESNLVSIHDPVKQNDNNIIIRFFGFMYPSIQGLKIVP